MKKMIGNTALLCGIALLTACNKTEPPKEEAEKPAAVATPDAETILASLKAPAALGLNVPVVIQLDNNGKPVFQGPSGSGISCGNTNCQPPTKKDKSFSFDSKGDLVLMNWDGAVQFIITVEAPGYSFPKDPDDAVAIVAGVLPPTKGNWNSQFTEPTGTPDRKTIFFSDKNTKNGTWEYSVTIQNDKTGELKTLDPTVQNNGVGVMAPIETPKPR